eukprot:GEMP01080399.1.p1 GENE.GEMP01080399.1~~GEMP01080399.1.p1  ORF type:complete len:100 (+),score=11.17 GEMP01080399.1:42-302(+)
MTLLVRTLGRRLAMQRPMMQTRSFAHMDDPTKIPKPAVYDDMDASQGFLWNALVGTALITFVVAPLYDSSRPTQIRLKVFGTNAPF